jgi:hypothetical protein
VVKRKPKLILTPFLDNLTSAFPNVVLNGQMALRQKRYRAFAMKIFLHHECLVLNNVGVKLVVVEVAVILEVERVTLNVNVFNQVRKLAALHNVLCFFVLNRHLAVVFKVFALFMPL